MPNKIDIGCSIKLRAYCQFDGMNARGIREEWVKTHRLRSSSCKPIIAYINWRLQNYLQNMLSLAVYFRRIVPLTTTKDFYPDNKIEACDENFVCAVIRVTESTSDLGPFLPIERNEKLNAITITLTQSKVLCAGKANCYKYTYRYVTRALSICSYSAQYLRYSIV